MHGLKNRRKFFTKKVDGERLSKRLFVSRKPDEQQLMSRRQCCVWGCHNRKGRCAVDISGNRLCKCPVLQVNGCPKPHLLTLHTINKMPETVKRAVVQKINLTRQSPGGSKWLPSTEAVICNVHYLHFIGPTRGNKNLVPVYFKRPDSYPVLPAPKKRRVIVRGTSAEGDVQDSTISDQNDSLDDGSSSLLHTDFSSDEDVDYTVETNSADLVSLPTGDLDAGPDSTVRVSPNDFHPAQSELHSLDTEVASSSTQPIINAEPCSQPAVRVSSDNLHPTQPDSIVRPDSTVRVSPNDLHHTQPLSDSLLDVTSIVSRCSQLEQENSELHAENLVLKRKLESFNSHVQRLSLSLLTDCQVQMYTGLSRKVFECLCDWLNPVLRNKGAIDELTPSQKLFLMLMKLRCNFTQSDLACRFRIEQSSVSRILNQWIPMLKVQLNALIRWPQTTIGPTDPPYNLLPNTVAIIDGTEIFIQRPSNLATQKSSYSDYKSHTTVKYLVGIDTFTGVFVYVSPGFSGNSSDRFTVQQSGILDELKPGQRILADKGYNARDLFAQKRCFLTIPSFLSDGRLTAQEGMQSRTIASVRIRVENAIKRLKEYKALSETLSNRVSKKIVDDMVIVVSALCNLKQKLIK